MDGIEVDKTTGDCSCTESTLPLGCVGFIGAGNMACAIMDCISGTSEIIASRRSVNALRALKSKYNLHTTTDNRALVEASDIIFICVKPQSADALFQEIADLDFSDKMVISILAGKKIEYFTSNLKGCTRVVRAMPNLGLLVGKGATAYTLSKKCTKNDEKKAHIILNSGAIAIKVQEEDLDTITALSGCGPAFLSYFLSAMEDAAVSQGLDKHVARTLLFQTVVGTYDYLKQNDEPYDSFIKRVASEGGATQAGIKAANKAKIPEAISEMLESAVKRAIKLGE